MRLFELHDTEDGDGNQPDATRSGVFCCGKCWGLWLGAAPKANIALVAGVAEASGAAGLAIAAARAEGLSAMRKAGGVVAAAGEARGGAMARAEE